MAGVFSIMVLLGIAFATGILPVGITADFARWYLIFPQIGLIMAALAAISLYWGRPGKTSTAARAGMLGIFALGGLYMTADLIGDARVAAAQEVSRAELVGVRDTLADLSPNGACFLITESRAIADGLHTVQLYKPLEYAEVLTHCRILNGSFLQRGIAGGRSLGDVPDYAALSSLPQDAPVYLVASQDLENQYRPAMPQARFQPMNRQIGPYPIWKLILASDAPAASASGLNALLGLIDDRLAVMPDVARHKYNSGAAVEDLAREAQVIEAVTAQAVAAGLDKEVASTFFQAQIDASKMIQAERVAVWKAEGHAPFADVPDLSTVIRPKLDALTPALIAALKDALPELKLGDAGARLEAYAVGRGGEDEGAFRRAMAPLGR
jgi:chorismate mutase